MSRGFHTLFGITLGTELALPLVQNATPGIPEVEVVVGRVSPGPRLIWHGEAPEPFHCTQADNHIVLDWNGMRFDVTANRIVVDADDLDAAVVPLLQATWSVLLSACGREALHASVLAHRGQAIAVAGPSGSGKSTAALALIDRGWQLVADDLLTLDDMGRALPGPPFIRLTPERAVGRDGVWDSSGKLRYFPLLSDEPVPLAAVVVHGDASTGARRLSGVAAIDALLSNIYNDVLMHPGQARRRLDFAMALTQRVPVYGVPPRSLTAEQLLDIAENVTVLQ